MKHVIAGITSLFMATGAAAQDDGFAYETSNGYDRDSFEALVPCLEDEARAYFGDGLSDFNSEVGLITASNGRETVMLSLSGEQYSSDNAMVGWIAINAGEENSAITFNGFSGPIINITAPEERQAEVKRNIQTFEDRLRQCGPRSTPAAAVS